MRMYDIILAKRDGKELSKEQIQFWIDRYTTGEIPDYQVSALLMAIYFNGMNEREINDLTMIMAHSGDLIDLSVLHTFTVDKHSTGGVGDKTTLLVVPIVSACGVTVPKMSGRGLGHTGGTIDKLSAIPGFRSSCSMQEFLSLLKQHQGAIVSQTGRLAPADKMIYALRDVTATVDILPLIASSIMSKKIASGADAIVLDVKVGSGAFLKALDEAQNLAHRMVDIGNAAGKKTVAILTNMDRPLGCAIGNTLEVIEAIETLQQRGPEDLTQICLTLSAAMLFLAGRGSYEACMTQCKDAITSGRAYEKFCEIVAAQGGDVSYIRHPEKFGTSKYFGQLLAPKTGYISQIDSYCCGRASVLLGAGRNTKQDAVDYSAGILFHRTVGDMVTKGECIATLYSNKEASIAEAKKQLQIQIDSEQPKQSDLVLEYVGF